MYRNTCPSSTENLGAVKSQNGNRRVDVIEKLAKYRADPSVPSLARGTVLHQIVYQFKGDDAIRLSPWSSCRDGTQSWGFSVNALF